MSLLCNRRTARDVKIPQRLPFKASALSGGTDTDSLGILPEPYREEYKAAEKLGQITYVVRSYATPIAWVLDSGEVVVPDVKYSATSSNHQTIARFALCAARVLV